MGNHVSKPPESPGEIPPAQPHKRDGGSIVLTIMLILGLCAGVSCAGIIGMGAFSYTTVRRDFGTVAEDLTPQAYADGVSHTDTFSRHYNTGNYGAAFSAVQQELASNPESAEGRNNMAWILATCPDPEYRDGKAALEHAQTICEASNHSKSEYLDTLAAAHAQLGEFEAAVKWQTEAIRVAPAAANRDGFQARLELYQSEQPYRHSPQ